MKSEEKNSFTKLYCLPSRINGTPNEIGTHLYRFTFLQQVKIKSTNYFLVVSSEL